MTVAHAACGKIMFNANVRKLPAVNAVLVGVAGSCMAAPNLNGCYRLSMSVLGCSPTQVWVSLIHSLCS